MKIVIAASEVVPFVKTGGLADVAGALPVALDEAGEEPIVVMPRYKSIDAAGLKIERSDKGVEYSVIGKNIRVYFIENRAFFDRGGLYGDEKGDYKDNLARFSFYCRKTLELLKEINFKPEIIHLHDWQASLIPVYLKAEYNNDPFFKDSRTLLTIHNIAYQGAFAKREFAELGLDQGFLSSKELEFHGKLNLLKGGIEFSDAVNTVSPTYSRQVQEPEFGFGLEEVLSRPGFKISGILNGLDYSLWNPESDNLITHRYSAGNLEDKYKNKEELQGLCGLSKRSELPLLGVVSRLARQKGLDILSAALGKLCRMDLQLVILGTGDLEYHKVLKQAAKKYPKIISLHLKFDNPLAHKIYAGSDIFLMPSRYEPCGLGQMIALRYGTIPLVFKTGGLADTVNKENGFIFDNYTEEALFKAAEEAIGAFRDKQSWTALIRRAMQCNFSWAESAKKYLELYEKIKGR